MVNPIERLTSEMLPAVAPLLPGNGPRDGKVKRQHGCNRECDDA